ncbi:MAG: hypothetical protein ACXW2O_10080 [Candidatus Aminicenantales bacterium]
MKKYLTPQNIILVVVLIIVAIWKSGGLIILGLERSLVYFFVGMFEGMAITGLFMFFYNIFKPDNKIKLGIPARITAGLIGAILSAFVLEVTK